VPPDNRPLPEEVGRCGERFLDRELALLSPRVVLALGEIAWNAVLDSLARTGVVLPRPRPRFAHGAESRVPRAPFAIVGSYHVSQQNTQTGKLTVRMFDRIVRRCATLALGPPP
jgi:uracil-DNA glycosylase